MDLDRQVAEALGERVCGGEARSDGFPWGRVGCDRCGAEHDFGAEWPAGFPRILHLPPPPYSTSWEAAGRLVKEMAQRGWRLDFRVRPRGVEAWATREADCTLEAYAQAPTFPEAASRAALRALGERGEG
jgi:hypothetical protein